MDASLVPAAVWSVITILASGIAAVVVGRRKGVDQVEAKVDAETKALVEAQSGRLAILEAENRRLTAEVASLTTQLAAVRADLELEKKITARIRNGAG